MELYTYQIANWRYAKDLGVELLDTTVKSGLALLAPTWNMVLGHKSGELSDEDYTQLYNEILKDRYKRYPEQFHQLLKRERLALGCYCRPGNFCHRHLIVKFLEQLDEEVIYCGEILRASVRKN